MSVLLDRTIATDGSGVMAEAMIAGLLRDRHVQPDQLVASHPRADRREQLARDYGIRAVASNSEAVAGVDIVVLAIKPQMLIRVGRELASAMTPGQLVISIVAGATTRALMEVLDHPQVVRAAEKAYDEEAWRRLWEVSQQLTGVRFNFTAAPARS